VLWWCGALLQSNVSRHAYGEVVAAGAASWPICFVQQQVLLLGVARKQRIVNSSHTWTLLRPSTVRQLYCWTS
jgi:hypothetical protein